MITAAWGAACCGSTAPAPPGATCRSAMARSERCRAASIAGAERGFGTASSRPFRLRLTRGARSTGICTLWMPRSFAPTNTPPALAGPAPSGGEAPDEALGRSQGGFSTKIHLRAEGHGRPITAVLTGGERHEQIALADVLDRGAIPRAGRGRPRLRPRRVAGDKGSTRATAAQRLGAVCDSVALVPSFPARATNAASLISIVPPTGFAIGSSA